MRNSPWKGLGSTAQEPILARSSQEPVTTNRTRRVNKQRISALLTLLQDDDVKIASLAMEQFLGLGELADATIAEYQESQNPQLRQRIHQLSSVLRRRRLRESFLDALGEGTLSLWAGVVDIAVLYDSTANVEYVENQIASLRLDMGAGDSGAAHLAKVMKDRELRVPSEEILDVDLYLVDRVLETGTGSAVVLCALAQQAADGLWPSTIVLHNGRFCLLDADHTLLEPTEGWRITKMAKDEKVHPCGIKDTLLALLTQLFLVSLVDGSLRELHHFGSMLTALNRTGLDALPPPLGRAGTPVPQR